MLNVVEFMSHRFVQVVVSPASLTNPNKSIKRAPKARSVVCLRSFKALIQVNQVTGRHSMVHNFDVLQ